MASIFLSTKIGFGEYIRYINYNLLSEFYINRILRYEIYINKSIKIKSEKRVHL